MLSRHYLFFCGLVLLFGASFLAPILIGASVTGVREPAPSERRLDATFPGSKVIETRSDAVVVAHSPVLEPAAGEDFLAFGWFKLKVYPKDGQRTVLFSKYDTSTHLGAGYALALTGENGVIRPSVYWRDTAGSGRWLQFAELPRRSLDWCLFALSLHDSRYLGVHGAFLSEADESVDVMLLGGYDVSKIGAPQSDRPLLFGAGGSRRFAGRLGPIGVFSLPRFDGDFKKILRDYIEAPLDPSEAFRAGEMKLWSADLERDSSSHAHAITTLGSGSMGGDDDEDPAAGS